MNKKYTTMSAAGIAAAIALAGCSAGSGGSMPGMDMGGSGMSSSSEPAGAPTAGPISETAPADAAPERVRPPNNDNAPLTMGIAAAVVALAGAIFFLAQRRRARNSGA